MTNPPRPKRRWYQYSLRTLFVVMTLVAIACSWYAYEMNEAAKRRAAIVEIEKLGGVVVYDDSSDPSGLGESPAWYSLLRKLHGDEHLGNALAVDLMHRDTVTDAGVVNLKGLTKLRRLRLYSLQITDAGLANLKGLTNLEYLWIGGPQVADAGLVHLKGLTKLEELGFVNTQITDAGLVHLKDSTKLERLNLVGTEITDAGLVNLKGLTKLKELWIGGTQITDEGLKKLQEVLPNCEIHH